MVWDGGVTGPEGAPLGEAQRLAVHVELEDASVVTPIALADDDPDNFVHACVAEAAPAVSVSIDPGLFHDPGDDPNLGTDIGIVDLFE